MKHFFFSILVSLIAIHSYCQTGSPITSFGTSGNANTVVGSGSTTADMAVQSDGKLIVAGYATVGGNSDFALARFKSDGTLDPSFNGTGKQSTAIGSASDYLSAIALQSDGKIVAVGYCVVGSVYNIGLARYLSDGTLDAGFSGDGKLTTSLGASGSTTGMDVAIQGDGKIVVVGSYNSNMIVVRYNTDGS
ncbi:MAG TPA: delta-60 repeat domain-containing protein, partial [Flavisolibacter sp.]|nr:delta-60 repeat domain-containing protein [Flavisolibacter sp.]